MINVGIIGAGNIAIKMAETIPNVEAARAYGIASRDLSKAEAFRDKYQMDKAYGSYLELVQDPAIDLVYIATPHNFHFAHAKLALEHGKHVLCEKSVTINRQQLEELLVLARQKEVAFVEAIWSRYMPLHLELLQLLKEDVIGELAVVKANLCYPIEHVERMHNPLLAGGALLDLGVYCVHFALSILGNDYDSISSTMTLTDAGVDRHTSILLHYPGGQMAQLFTSMNAGNYDSATILGSKGRIEIQGTNYIDELFVYDAENNCSHHLKRPADHGGFEYEVAESLRLIANGATESDIVTHEDSLAVMQVMDTVRQQNGMKYPEEV